MAIASRLMPTWRSLDEAAKQVAFFGEGVLRAQRYNPRLGRRVDLVMFSLLRGELNLSS